MTGWLDSRLSAISLMQGHLPPTIRNSTRNTWASPRPGEILLRSGIGCENKVSVEGRNGNYIARRGPHTRKEITT